MTYKIEDYTSDQWQSAYRKWVATPLNKEEEALMNEDLEWIAEARKAFTK